MENGAGDENNCDESVVMVKDDVTCGDEGGCDV